VLECGLIENTSGALCFAVVQEDRKIKEVVYLSQERRLRVDFKNGEEEIVNLDITNELEAAIFRNSTILIAHFPKDAKPESDPSDEYTVQIIV
jgi:hypothetical protein